MIRAILFKVALAALLAGAYAQAASGRQVLANKALVPPGASLKITH